MHPSMNVRHQAPQGQHPIARNAPLQNEVLRYGTPNKKLVDAVKYANENDFVSLMNAALADGADINIIDEQKKTLIEMAVTRDSVRIARALITQGVLLPDPDSSGFDLLMYTAVHGNVPMMELLMDVYDLQPDATDNGDWTALHYAAMSQSPAAVEALLRRDLDCNDSATGTDHNSLCQIFGEKYGCENESLTPLNIAIVSGHPRSVQLLLEHGASLFTGVGSSILKAVQCRDPAKLEILLEHCKRDGSLSAVLNHNLLSETLIDDDHTQMLSLLLEYDQVSPIANFDLDEALLLAVALEHTSQVALLLEHGAQLSASQDFHWALAAKAQDRTLLELLTASCGKSFEALLVKSPDGGPARLLTELSEIAFDTVQLSQRGIFISMLHDAIPALTSLSRESQSLSKMQIAAETAHILLRFVLPSPQPHNEASEDESAAASALVSAAELQLEHGARSPSSSTIIQQMIAVRSSRIVNLAASQIDTLNGALATCLSAIFLSDIRDASEDGKITPAMEYQLRVISGVPEALVGMIIDAWMEAESLFLKDSNSSAQPDATAVSRLMANTLFCKLDQMKIDPSHFLTMPNSLLHDCARRLSTELSTQRAQWRTMISQPANFLRKLEGRIGLRPVSVPTLTQAIINATGLPASVCGSMASCWERAVQDAGSTPDSGSATQRFQRLDQSFAGYWQDWLEENASDSQTVLFPFTPHEVLDAIDWCDQIRQASAASLKRKASSEPDGAPPPKPPRLQ